VSLKVLDLSFNAITTVPNEILNFYRLQQLVLNDNRINRLPWRMDKLRRCKILFLQNNDLRFFPSFLVKMRGLEVLEISNNPVDNVTYGQPRSADDLLAVLAKQRPPSMYEADLVKEHPVQSADHVLLKNILRYKEGINSMEEFCKKELNTENLHFFLKVRKFRLNFKSATEIKHPDLIAEAKNINEHFVKVKSPEQINFSFDVLHKLRTKFDDDKELNQWMFDEVFDIVTQYLVDEILGRFKTMRENTSLLAQVHKQVDKRRKEKFTLCGKKPTPIPSKNHNRGKSMPRNKSVDLTSSQHSQSSELVSEAISFETRSFSEVRSSDILRPSAAGAVRPNE
jgi:hypothetical protein